MRPHLREFLNQCAAVLPCPEPIVEIGAFQVPGQEAIAELRPLFPGKKYIGCDMQHGTGVDRIENIHHLKFGDGEVGAFILADTFEHVADPIRGMREVHRCLREDGVVIYTSVMHFPIHAYPNDYWRFTPEAFRAMAEQYETSAIFFAGDPNFPHTVCGIAAKAKYDPQNIRALIEPLAQIQKPAPLIVEGRASAIIRHLVAKALPAPAPKPRKPEIPSGFGPMAQPGWWLVTGQWIEGWISADGVEEVEILAGEKVIHRAKLSHPRTDLAEKHHFQPKDKLVGFRGQVDLHEVGDYTGTLTMMGIGAAGRRLFARESAPGMLLGTQTETAAFTLHSFDERLAGVSISPQAVEVQSKVDPALANLPGPELLEALRKQGEPIHVDLGCGFRKNGNIGIDVSKDGTAADFVCRLGFEPIPLPNESADTIFCRDFLEHLPKSYYSERDEKLKYPIIDLFNEIWRVLKPGGTFTSFTPCYPHDEIHQDPTHLSVWTMKSMLYFTGHYPVARIYGVRTNFELLENERDGFYLRAVLRKPATGARA